MQDDEANRFSARACRYARLGVNAGALAARMASSRVTGARGGDAQALAQALGSLKGPMMKVAQMMATIPEALPADYAEELIKPAVAGAADGRGLRQAAHAGRTRRRLAGALCRIRSDAGRRRFARPGSSRRQPRGRARSPASCNIPTWPRRWRRISSSSIYCSRSIAEWVRRSTPARSRARSARALREELDYEPRGQDRKALSEHARRSAAGARAPHFRRRCRPGAC